MIVRQFNCVCVCQVVDLPSTLKVEVYPIEIFLCLHSNMENVITSQFSRTDNIREFVFVCVCVRVCELHDAVLALSSVSSSSHRCLIGSSSDQFSSSSPNWLNRFFMHVWNVTLKQEGDTIR